jgi:hypothetical protein
MSNETLIESSLQSRNGFFWSNLQHLIGGISTWFFSFSCLFTFGSRIESLVHIVEVP